MTQAGTPRPGEDPGTLIEDEPDTQPVSDEEIESDPEPLPKPCSPREGGPDIEDTQQQPT